MENNVPEAVCRERLRVADEHFKRVDERLKIGEGKIDKVSEAIVLLTQMTKQNKDDICEHEKRITSLEHRPNVWLDKIIAAAIAGGISLIFNLFA